MHKSRGFTVVELVIAIAIIGILAAIAIPSYTEHLKKGRRADAQQFLSQVAQKQQQYLMDARTYAGTLTDIDMAAVPPNVAKFYTVTVAAVAGPPPLFTITATPIAGTAQEADGRLTIDNNGNKLRSAASGDVPW